MGETSDTLRVFEADVPLQSGRLLRGARLVYQVHGLLNAAGDNAILYPTRFGGTHAENAFLIGPGRALDPGRYCIIVPNMLGNGVSSSPSNTPHPFGGPRFPAITIADNVRLQHQLLTEVMGVARLELAVGWSMGAQQAFQWAALYPDMVARLAAICGTARTAPHNIVFLESLRAALAADSTFAEGWYEAPPRRGLRAMGRIYAGRAYSQAWYRERTFEAMGYTNLDDYLIGYWDGLFERREANDLLAMIWTWIHNDISANDVFEGDFDAALAAITAPSVVMPCETDLYFRVTDNTREVARMPNAELRTIPSIWGHMAGAGQNPADTAFIDGALKELLGRPGGA